MRGMTQLRADAAVRRRQLLDAADEIFSEHGVHAPLELVIARAGVGRATLYRNFADRSALLVALLERGLDGLERFAATLGEKPDALPILMRDVAETIAQSAPMVDFWRSVENTHPILEQADRRALAIFMPFVRRAIAAGRCRTDIDEEQMLLALDMMGSCLRGDGEAERKRVAGRCADMLIQAFGISDEAARVHA